MKEEKEFAEEKTEKKRKAEKPSLRAKKDFVLWHPGDAGEYRRHIKAGEDLGDVPELYHPNLKAEGVI